MGKVFKALNKVMSDDGQRTAVPAPDHSPPAGIKKLNVAEPEFHANIPAGSSDEPRDTSAWDEKLVAFSDSSSSITESFRHLRTKILHPPSGRPLRKVLITSAIPGEGKSLICANLGISVAQGLEQHALLVDCDLRRSSLARLFAVHEQQGLVNYLLDGVDLGTLINKTGLRKLSLIPSGPKPVNPAELLDSQKVSRMFEELSSRYDDRFIFIDTPPLQAASETLVLAKQVDGIILVVRWGSSGRDQVRQMVDNLDRDKIIGVVFNGFESNVLSTKLSGYESYGHYGAGY